MSLRTTFKTVLFAGIILLLASCSRAPGSMDAGSEADGGLSSHGLGQLNSRFAGQEEGEVYTTKAPHNQIYLFSYDDSTLASKYVPSVNAQIAYLKQHPGAKVMLTGHTDDRGSREYNIALGERRANTVADLMRMAGINQSQLRVVSYGKERPAKYGDTPEARHQNRRVELIYEATR